MPTSRDEAATQRHAQAVRFLTSLRSQNKDAHINLTQEHRDFLQSKGLSDADIERARQDAERPEYTSMLRVFDDDQTRVLASGDAQAFEKAADAFDNENAVASAPAPPAASYPRSPFALYSSPEELRAQQPRDANQILTEFAAAVSRPRYDTLISFFRTLHFLLMLTGGAAALFMVVYRRFLIPKLAAMVDARTGLISLQTEHFSKIREGLHSILGDRLGRLLPQDYEPEWREVEIQEEEDLFGVCKATVQKVDDEAERKGSEDAPAKPVEDEKADAPQQDSMDEKLGAEGDAASQEFKEQASPKMRRVLAPIDVTKGLRSSLNELAQALRESQLGTAAPSSVSESDDEGLLDLSAMQRSPGNNSTSASSSAATIHTQLPPLAPSASMSSFKNTFDAVRNELRASVLSDEESMNMIGSRFSAFTQPSSRPTSGPAVEMLQIKAEIRSLKGLLLSRRNFPSFMRTRPATQAGTASTSAS